MVSVLWTNILEIYFNISKIWFKLNRSAIFMEKKIEHGRDERFF